jgi:hypothetical protein
MRLRTLVGLAGVALTVPNISAAQTRTAGKGSEASCGQGQSPIMILGMYHMSNPGLDAVNLDADDVLQPKRQREIQELVDRLAKFRPTKIAVEAPYRSTTVPDRYKSYVAGTYQLTHNETEQIGFRLARQLGLPGVTPIDFPMFMSGQYQSELDLAPKADTTKRVTATAAKPRELSPRDKQLRESTVTQFLRFMNTDSVVKKDHAGYLNMLKERTAPAMYQQTDLVTNWYKRNLRMFTNLNREVEHGKDRVLVLVGAGHITLLRQLAEGASYYCVVDPLTYLN